MTGRVSNGGAQLFPIHRRCETSTHRVNNSSGFTVRALAVHDIIALSLIDDSVSASSSVSLSYFQRCRLVITVLLIVVAILVAAMILNTAVLAGSLVLVGNEELNKDFVLRCLGIVFLALMCGLIPVIGGLVSMAVFFVGIIVGFEKTFGQAFLVSLCVWVMSIAVSFGLTYGFQAFFS